MLFNPPGEALDVKGNIDMPDFLAEAAAIEADMIALRRGFHQRPELGRAEHATSARIAEELSRLGIEVRKAAGTGVVGIFRGARPGRCVALRADMDALPVEEATGLPFSSENPGVMHACGHDMHAAALLGAARLLADRRAALCGSVRFFFQPDEEGDGGAQRMIDDGCMEGVDAVFGAHVSPELPVGMVAVRPGKAYAASNPFDLTVRGRSAHGAEPHLGADAIVAASAMVGALQTLVSRTVSPLESAVVSVGSFHAGTARNIIAGEAQLSGIIRCFGHAMRRELTERMSALIQGMAAAHGVEAELKIHWGYSGVINDEKMTALLHASAVKLLGEGAVTDETFPTLGTEDFGAFLDAAPGSYWHVGVGRPGCKNFPLHNPGFNPDESALKIAAALHAQTAWDFLSS